MPTFSQPDNLIAIYTAKSNVEYYYSKMDFVSKTLKCYILPEYKVYKAVLTLLSMELL